MSEAGRNFPRIALLACLLSLWATPAFAANGAPKLDYKVEFVGFDETGLKDEVRDHADLLRFKDDPPASIWDLRARIRRDLNTFAKVLRAEGYFAARLSYDLLRNKQPIVVRIRAIPGTRFKIDRYEIELGDDPGVPQVARDFAERAAKRLTGQPSRNQDIVNGYQAVLDALPENGYPQAKLVDLHVEADHNTQTVSARITIDVGPKVYFGETAFHGLENVRPGVVRKELAWSPGDVYDSRKVEYYRKQMVELDLFDSIEINTEAPLEAGSRQPMLINLSEADHHTIGVGASYSTSKGFGGEVFWEHRNFRGRGENLLPSLKGDEQKQAFTADFTKHRFLRRDQKLLLGFEGARDDTDAYLEHSATVSGAIERQITKRWKARAGLELGYDNIRDQVDREDYFLFGVPALVAYDSSDDLLNPSKGVRLAAEVTPYLAYDGGAQFFTILELTGSGYWALDSDHRYIAAARTRVGFLFGQMASQVPASKRFYAGGGASIRGYKYQSVGPLDAEGDPLGGRSVFEVGAELRIRLTESWGVVPFIEGGNVFEELYPSFTGSLRWAAGLGIRYYTGFGPIRLDVAFPINGRPVDSTFQIYVSIGQSF